MKTSTSVMALAAAASAQNMSICDKYTTALLKTNNAANQQTLLTLVVNTAVIGNYTKPNVGIKVPGILAPGTGQYEGVNLLPYFSGALASTNNGGSMGVSQNFLDGGGATPLEMNKPANDTSSAQYTLLTHLYEYFAYLLGCSEFGNTTMPYAGSTNMYEVHKYMALDNAEVEYFIEQVGLSAASFGVSTSDVNTVGMALKNAFGYRCSPPASIPASASPEPQAICIASDCPLSPSATCALYSSVVEPSSVSMTSMPTSMSSGMSSSMMMSGSMTATATMAMGSSMPSGSSTGAMPPAYTGAASLPVISSFAAVALGLLAFFL